MGHRFRNTEHCRRHTAHRLMHTSIYETQLKHELLSEREEQALLYRAKAGDTAARERLILLNIKLIRGVVLKYERRDAGISADDLMADGILGLNRAIDKYDDTFGTRLSTYATLWIHQMVARSPFLNTTVRLPNDVKKRVRKINKAKSDLAKAGQHITAKAISKATQIDINEVQQLMHLESDALPHQSLDERLPDHKYDLLHTIADPSSEQGYTAIEIQMDLDFFLNQLYAEERFIIERSFGIPIPLENIQIAKAIGCHKNHITKKERTFSQC